MSFSKYGEALAEIQLENTESCIPDVDPEYLEQFRSTAAALKKIAPKAEDFLYFTAIMMHAAEAAGIHDDGTPKMNAKGEAVQVGWDKSNNTWKWTTNDPNIRPYKNSNGDIFPEEELVKAHKKWVHKPLCIDHKSSSVDHTRGFIVDAYYDRKLKRVVALCALDKANYPDLARKVATLMQTAVSMGTAVGRAICTEDGCHRVARSEADFCKHMKTKSCYGEINVDLTPIELSIVMNGADQKAVIKQVLAMANTLSTYVDIKEKELSKFADTTFTASLAVMDPAGKEGNTDSHINITSKSLDAFKSDLENALAQLAQITQSAKNTDEDTNSSAFNQSSGSIAMDEGAPTDAGLALQTPQNARFASDNSDKTDISQLHTITANIESRLNQMKRDLDKLTMASMNKQEENMTGSNELNKKAYFQGAGGVNEPTPGQVKYPKDPLNEQLREHEDKQMLGQPPFPEVGPVDGMHPSPASADPSDELQRKKMLARAEVEDRQLRREALAQTIKDTLLNKQSYYLGGGGVNEPTPGKPKYPKDKLNEELREYEDKQMVGQPPFPGVGPVDGLHPSPSSADPKDELKRKEMLARASALRARFVHAYNDNGSKNLGKSAWEVFKGDKLLLTASVTDLSHGRPEVFYDGIATKEFGVKLIEKIKSSGAETVAANLFKKAQVPPPGGDAGVPPAAPAPDASAPDVGAPPVGGDMDAVPPVEDTGKSGDPKKTALELSEKVRDLSSDLVDAVRALTGEQAEMGAEEGATPPGGVGSPAGGPAMADDSSGKSSTASAEMNATRKQLNNTISFAMKEIIASLNNHKEELDMIAGLYDKGGINNANKDVVDSIVDDAFNEAKASVADGFKVMAAFVKYARGTNAIVKRAEIQAELESLAAEEGEVANDEDSNSADGLMDFINDTNLDLDNVGDMMNHDTESHEGEENLEQHDPSDLEGLAYLQDANDAVQVNTPEEAAMVAQKNPEASVTVQAALKTLEGRAALRAKLAADALGKEDDGEIQDMSKQKFSDMLDQADRLADGQTHLEVKPSDNLGLVETLEEQNKAFLEVAKAPPKVRKEAEIINDMITQGTLNPEDLDTLVAEGLDKDAVAYWKKFYGQVDGGSEFASELVKEHVKAGMEEELNKYRVKIARAYELAYDMAARGMVNTSKGAIALQVDEIMQFDDPSFQSLKKVIASHPLNGLRKEASRLPAVGFADDSEYQASPAVIEDSDDYGHLSSMFGRKRGMF